MQIPKLITTPQISFMRKSIIKTLFLEGKLPEVTLDIYGKPIDPKKMNVQTLTIEHLIPKSQGGKSKLSNYALANVKSNNTRSSEDLLKHTTLDNIKTYFGQFEKIDLPEFNGKQYIDNCIQTLKKIDIII